jgi:hypothetical protein
MAPTKRSIKGMGYKSEQHKRKGGGKKVVDPQRGKGKLMDEYGGGR